MKTTLQMMKEVVEGNLKLLNIAEVQHFKNMKDKDWKRMYLKARKNYNDSIKSLKKFKP